MDMNIKIIFGITIIIGLIGIATGANPNMGIFKINDCFEIKQLCTINGTNCDFCNITSIDYPNGTRAETDLIMTKRNGDFNITFCSSSSLGRYNVNGYCTYGADVRKPFVAYFDITPTGYKMDISKSIISLVSVTIMIIVFILFLILATVFLHPGTKLFLLGLALTTIVFTTGYVLKIQQDTAGEFISFNSIFSSFYTLLTILLTGASIGLMLYFIVFAFKRFYKIRGYYN